MSSNNQLSLDISVGNDSEKNAPGVNDSNVLTSASNASAITSSEVMTTLQVLMTWSENGWLRRLDSALARFTCELDPAASDALLVSVALLSYFEGHGHTCLPISKMVSDPVELLGWPEDRTDDVRSLWISLPANLDKWLMELTASATIQSIFHFGAATSTISNACPFVLAGTRDDPVLYLRRYWNHEQFVCREIVRRVSTVLSVKVDSVSHILNQLFETSTDSNDFDWQKFACAAALRSSMTVITGGPGTGKTYTAARLLALLFAVDAKPDRLKIALAAPTGKAAARLRQSIDKALIDLNRQVGHQVDLNELARRIGAARTLHSLLGASSTSRQFTHNASHPLDVDVLIVDEASMVHLEMMSALLQALPRSAILILLGDKDQLDSVEAGAVLGDLTRHATMGCYSDVSSRYALDTTGQQIPESFCVSDKNTSALDQQIIMLRESRRFGAVIGRIALAVNRGDADEVTQLLSTDSLQSVFLQHSARPADILNLAVHGRQNVNLSYVSYLNEIKAWKAERDKSAANHKAWVKRVLTSFDQFRILCAVNLGDWGTISINRLVLNGLEQAGLINTGKTGKEWFVGRPVMVTRNDPDLGVFNGDVGVVLPSLRKSVSDEDASASNQLALRVYFLDGDNLRSVSVTRLAHVETAFAMTVHKSQGSEYQHVALLLPGGRNEHLSRELIYTGITRARDYLTIIEAQEGVLKRGIESPSSRRSGLARAIDSL